MIEIPGDASDQLAPAVAECHPRAGWRNLPSILLAHRRQTAAAIVLCCMAVLWSDDGPSTVPDSTAESATDMTSVESLLEDFETVDSGALREPAEPVEQSVDKFQITIPESPGDPALGSGGSAPSPSSTAVAVYPDESAASGTSTGGSFTIPNTTIPKHAGSTQDSATRSGVRFTGRIQPLK